MSGITIEGHPETHGIGDRLALLNRRGIDPLYQWADNIALRLNTTQQTGIEDRSRGHALNNLEYAFNKLPNVLTPDPLDLQSPKTEIPVEGISKILGRNQELTPEQAYETAHKAIRDVVAPLEQAILKKRTGGNDDPPIEEAVSAELQNIFRGVSMALNSNLRDHPNLLAYVNTVFTMELFGVAARAKRLEYIGNGKGRTASRMIGNAILALNCPEDDWTTQARWIIPGDKSNPSVEFKNMAILHNQLLDKWLDASGTKPDDQEPIERQLYETVNLLAHIDPTTVLSVFGDAVTAGDILPKLAGGNEEAKIKSLYMSTNPQTQRLIQRRRVAGATPQRKVLADQFLEIARRSLTCHFSPKDLAYYASLPPDKLAQLFARKAGALVTQKEPTALRLRIAWPKMWEKISLLFKEQGWAGLRKARYETAELFNPYGASILFGSGALAEKADIKAHNRAKVQESYGKTASSFIKNSWILTKIFLGIGDSNDLVHLDPSALPDGLEKILRAYDQPASSSTKYNARIGHGFHGNPQFPLGLTLTVKEEPRGDQDSSIGILASHAKTLASPGHVTALTDNIIETFWTQLNKEAGRESPLEREEFLQESLVFFSALLVDPSVFGGDNMQVRLADVPAQQLAKTTSEIWLKAFSSRNANTRDIALSMAKLLPVFHPAFTQELFTQAKAFFGKKDEAFFDPKNEGETIWLKMGFAAMYNDRPLWEFNESTQKTIDERRKNIALHLVDTSQDMLAMWRENTGVTEPRSLTDALVGEAPNPVTDSLLQTIIQFGNEKQHETLAIWLSEIARQEAAEDLIAEMTQRVGGHSSPDNIRFAVQSILELTDGVKTLESEIDTLFDPRETEHKVLLDKLRNNAAKDIPQADNIYNKLEYSLSSALEEATNKDPLSTMKEVISALRIDLSGKTQDTNILEFVLARDLGLGTSTARSAISELEQSGNLQQLLTWIVKDTHSGHRIEKEEVIGIISKTFESVAGQQTTTLLEDLGTIAEIVQAQHFLRREQFERIATRTRSLVQTLTTAQDLATSLGTQKLNAVRELLIGGKGDSFFDRYSRLVSELNLRITSMKNRPPSANSILRNIRTGKTAEIGAITPLANRVTPNLTPSDIVKILAYFPASAGPSAVDNPTLQPTPEPEYRNAGLDNYDTLPGED
ncbi:MAG: hypothetical protein UY18_C0023G0006 [Microgenomates group bacterium GW2011_GWF2_47_9]|nr:MAG: hypothetical protein UY18_C0023G0006 [Microgenomates group bacterium GW2011_GWF2_47_9]